MDVNQARFLFEIQRVSERVAAECPCTPPAVRPAEPRAFSLRHTLATGLHRLAAHVDVPSPQPI